VTGMESDYRIAELGRRVDRLDRLEPAVQVQRITDLVRDVHDLREEMRGVKRALYTFAGSLLVSAVMFAVVVLASGHGHA
jgi:hypothetical protein